MKRIALPISKSIANRILLLQAIHGDPLMRVSAIGVPASNTQWGERDMPDDVLVLHGALVRLREHKDGEPLTLDLKNCGTALRFLQVHLCRCYPGEPITLTGDARLMERNGAPTTQTTSACILHGDNIPCLPGESPYITMSRKLLQAFREQHERSLLLQQPGLSDVTGLLEADWSAAAFWYEHVAIHGGELLLQGLTADSLQGDRIVADIYAGYFGVQTTFTSAGALLQKRSTINNPTSLNSKFLTLNFSDCPDLYPAVALTCERLGLHLHASGTERLRYKECDRIEAVARHEVRHDHRMAMALLIAGWPVDDTECIRKSYPAFMAELSRISAE